MRQFYRAKIYIKEERVTSTTGIETCSIENSYPIVVDDPSVEKNVPVTYGATLSMEQQLTTQTELETINPALKYLSKQYPLRKGFDDTTVGYAGKFSKLDGNFYQIVYVNHHWITVYSTKRNEV